MKFNLVLANVETFSSFQPGIRIGSLTLNNIGKVDPEKTFYTQDYIYPIGYQVQKIYWSGVNVLFIYFNFYLFKKIQMHF